MCWAGDDGGLPVPNMHIGTRYDEEFHSLLVNQLVLDLKNIIFLI